MFLADTECKMGFEETVFPSWTMMSKSKVRQTECGRTGCGTKGSSGHTEFSYSAQGTWLFVGGYKRAYLLVLIMDIIPYIPYCEAKIYELKKYHLYPIKHRSLFLQILSTELQPDKQ